MAKKITPALFNLFQKGELPKKFKIVGFSRREYSKQEFHDYVFSNLIKKGWDLKTCSAFCDLFDYQPGGFQSLKDFRALSELLQKIDDEWGVCANKLFYLAVPPQFYEVIFKNLSASKLTRPCSEEEGWTRVLVEKPFGKDLKTARKLDGLLSKLFQEIQIYRIDHYLAKEMLQNILTFRFANNFLEKGWDNKLIESVHIKLLENIGVEDRGSFYDGVGALRDVGQNHLLQMLALITMENPGKFGEADAIRKNRAKILKTLELPELKEVKSNTFRAQYDGYQTIKGVRPKSDTETYFKIKAFLKDPKWQGVPIILESGKKLKEQRKEIEVAFKHPTPCFCPSGEHLKNKLFIRMEPEEEITVTFWSKKPGLKMEVEERIFKFSYREKSGKPQYTEEYEKLLLDCIAGDQTLFVSSEEVEAMWRFTDPITNAWQKNLVPLKSYQPNTDEARKSSESVEKAPHLARPIKKEIGIIGLGKMGGNLARRLMEKGWKVHGYNKDGQATKELGREGLLGAYAIEELAKNLGQPRLLWLMVPAGKPIEETTARLLKILSKGDIVIDGGNSFYESSIKRSKEFHKRGIHFLDVGVSGGPKGARAGSSLMIGGDKKIFIALEGLFQDLAAPGGYGYIGKSGAGHFVKMVHNGIEYGMMQAIAEGFAVMKKSPFKLDLKRVAEIYNHGSVIESRLIGWIKSAYEEFGENLKKISGSVSHTGEGEWTVKTAKKLKVPTPAIEGAFRFRVKSEKSPSYVGKILSALRNQFGGHDVVK